MLIQAVQKITMCENQFILTTLCPFVLPERNSFTTQIMNSCNSTVSSRPVAGIYNDKKWSARQLAFRICRTPQVTWRHRLSLICAASLMSRLNIDLQRLSSLLLLLMLLLQLIPRRCSFDAHNMH